MVKAELTIEYKDEELYIGLDLLKREDWTNIEWQLANSLQESLLKLTGILKKSGKATETKQEIIKEDI